MQIAIAPDSKRKPVFRPLIILSIQVLTSEQGRYVRNGRQDHRRKREKKGVDPADYSAAMLVRRTSCDRHRRHIILGEWRIKVDCVPLCMTSYSNCVYSVGFIYTQQSVRKDKLGVVLVLRLFQ